MAKACNTLGVTGSSTCHLSAVAPQRQKRGFVAESGIDLRARALLLNHQDAPGCHSFPKKDPKKMNRRSLPSFGLASIAMMGLWLAVLACGNAPGSDEKATTGAQALTFRNLFYTCASTCAAEDFSSCLNNDLCGWPGTCASLCEQFTASECPVTATSGEAGTFGPFCQLSDGACQSITPCLTGEISETACEESTFGAACRWTPVGPCAPVAPCPTGYLTTAAECITAGPTCVATPHLVGGDPCPTCGT
jgi:hypothetical protein